VAGHPALFGRGDAYHAGALFVATPFVEGLPSGELIEATMMSLFFLSAVLTGGRRGMLLLTVLFAIPAIVGKWLNHLQPQVFSPAIFLVACHCLFGLIIVHICAFVLGTRQVNQKCLVSQYASVTT